MTEPRIDEFASEHFGLRIANVDEPDFRGALVGAGVDCVCLLADAAEPRMIRSAEAKGFRQTDIRITLARSTNPYYLAAAVRPYDPGDLDALIRIARESHRITRFYADPRFPDSLCDDLYEQWIRNSAAGWAAQTLVWDASEGAAGYCTIHRDGDTAAIGLIAVDAGARGQHIGSALVRRAINWAWTDGAKTISVVTQGRNVPALRLFESSGFKTTNVSVWLHRHFR